MPVLLVILVIQVQFVNSLQFQIAKYNHLTEKHAQLAMLVLEQRPLIKLNASRVLPQVVINANLMQPTLLFA